LENLAGGPRADGAQVAAAVAAYRQEVTVVPGDHAVVACNANNGDMVCAARAAWPGASVKVGHGRDGADDVLIAECDPDRLAARYDRVVIGSGDHAFIPLTNALRARGVVVVVVSRDRALCTELGRRACVCHRLPENAIPVGAAA